MRRTLLLATLLAAPTLGSAQLALGTMSFTNTNADPMAKTINIAECRSTTATVQISWQPTVQPTGSAVTYQLYASNKDTSVAANFTGATVSANDCPTDAASNPNNNTLVVKVGTLMNNPSLANQPFSTSAIAAALVTTTVTDPCSGTGSTVIYLCMQGQAGGTNFGAARATISLALTPPNATPQLLLPVSPGNNALTPSWADTANNTAWYQVQAVSVADPSSVPTTGSFDAGSGSDPADPALHSSGYVSGTQVRLGGLKNGVTYAVRVRSFTVDYNPSDPSNIGTGTPQLTTDFWDTYKNAGGQETGGCASGVAGPLGLLVLAGALALVRRRK